ncbi:1282_t:CDS:2 [Diversispora eburnea]|uniref:1282_t:CDS:1 n=1 Tax=Diversispora eburnea TaxID=1213867 RepID=A0A9N9ACX1_9GLOM|nr:1282_t:CDS:2 [Diversispora eburnea]
MKHFSYQIFIIFIGIQLIQLIDFIIVDAVEYEFDSLATQFDMRPLEIDRTDVPKKIIVGRLTRVKPILEICKILVKRGYNVTLIAPGNILPSPDYPNIKQISTGLPVNYREDPYLSHFNVYKDATESLKPDLFICDVYMNDVCLDIAWINNKPIVGFSEGLLASPFISYRSEIWYNCYISMENESFWNRFRCAIIEPIKLMTELWSTNDKLNKIRSKVGVPHPTSPLVQEIGPVMQDEYPILTPNLLSFINSHHKILYVSFNNDIYTTLENNIILLQSCAEAIQQKIIDGVIWSFLNPTFDEILSKSITLSDGTSFTTTEILSNQLSHFLITRFTSQFSILNHTNVKVFLNEGGYTSIYEALYTGTPILALPIEFGNLNNGERLERLGVGITINKMELNIKDILNKIKLLLENNKIQKNLKKVKVLTRINRLLKEWTPPEIRMGIFKEQLESSSPLYRYRANIQLFDRLMAITAISLGWGFLIGTYTGARAAGLQYLAENAHKPPKTKGEWYFYHKHKNVRMILGGFQSGFRLSRKTGLVCLSFGVIEGGLDELRKENDFFNSCAAGLASALIISGFCK